MHNINYIIILRVCPDQYLITLFGHFVYVFCPASLHSPSTGCGRWLPLSEPSCARGYILLKETGVLVIIHSMITPYKPPPSCIGRCLLYASLVVARSDARLLFIIFGVIVAL